MTEYLVSESGIEGIKASSYPEAKHYFVHSFTKTYTKCLFIFFL